MKKIEISEVWLKKQYIILEKSTTDIAGELKCHPSTIGRRLKKIGVILRHTHTGRSRKKISESNSGENNGMWKGDNVSYSGIHLWVRKHKTITNKCEICGKETDKLDCANISGEYRRDLNDWEYLCRSCHCKSDDRHYNLPHIL